MSSKAFPPAMAPALIAATSGSMTRTCFFAEMTPTKVSLRTFERTLFHSGETSLADLSVPTLNAMGREFLVGMLAGASFELTKAASPWGMKTS